LKSASHIMVIEVIFSFSYIIFSNINELWHPLFY
jgi:hypothetical protein